MTAAKLCVKLNDGTVHKFDAPCKVVPRIRYLLVIREDITGVTKLASFRKRSVVAVYGERS